MHKDTHIAQVKEHVKEMESFGQNEGEMFAFFSHYFLIIYGGCGHACVKLCTTQI